MTSSGVPSGARRAVDAITRTAATATPGQRWTAGLAIALAVVVLAFGLPHPVRLVAPSVAAAPTSPEPADGNPRPARPASPITDLAVQPEREPAPAVAAPTTTAAPGAPAPAPRPFGVVALVDPNAGQGDRTDGAMARRYLAAAGVDATVVELGDPFTTCDAARKATLAIAAAEVPTAVRECLRERDITLVSWRDDALLAPVAGDIATRRGAARSLVDTARRIGDDLGSRVVLVADERLRPSLEAAMPAARRAGLELVSSVWIEPDQQPSPAIALDLAGDEVTGVVFATSSANRSTIGSQLKTVRPGVALAVLDVLESVTAAAHPVLLDGMKAVTSVQFPWHPGASELRAACEDEWEEAQTPPLALSTAELVRALAWCQHVAIADAARDRLAAHGGDLATTLASLVVESPLTTRLERGRVASLEPTGVVVARWSSACTCWRADGSFEAADE